jgi:large subunit ribosomal protein L23
MALFSKKDTTKEAKKAASSKTAEKEKKELKKDVSGTILRPHVTEKAMMASEGSTYTFKVRRGATKPDIRRAVEKTYAVHVEGVRVLNVGGKKVYLAGRKGKKEDWRKAMVTVKKGETIEF